MDYKVLAWRVNVSLGTEQQDQGSLCNIGEFALKLPLCVVIKFLSARMLDPFAQQDTGARVTAVATGERVLHPFTGQRMATDTAQMCDQPCVVARYI